MIGFAGFGGLFAIMFIILMVLHWNYENSPKSSLARNYMVQIAGIVLMVFETALFQPLAFSFMSSFDCGLDIVGYECYGVAHISLMVSSLFVGILLILIIMLSIVFYTDDRPLPILPWENSCFVLRLCKIIKKFIISFALEASKNNKGLILGAIVCSFLLSFIEVNEVFTKIRMRDRKIYFAFAGFESIIAWLSLIILICLLTGHNLGNPFILLLLTAGIFLILIIWSNRNARNILLNKDIYGSNTVEEVEEYCRIILDTIEESKGAQKASIDGIITMHNLNCKDNHCPCKEIKSQCEESKPEEEEKQIEKTISMDKTYKTKEISNEINTVEVAEGKDKQKKLIMRLLVLDLERWNRKQEGKTRIHIFIGYLKMNTSYNLMACLYEEMCAEEIAAGIYEEYHAFRLKYFF